MALQVAAHLVHGVVGEMVHQISRFLPAGAAALHRIDFVGAHGLAALIASLHGGRNECARGQVKRPSRTGVGFVVVGRRLDAMHVALVRISGVIAPVRQ